VETRKSGAEARRFFVDGGFAQVRADTVTVLTGRALKAEEINTAAVEQALHEPAPAIATPETAEARHKVQERARAQLRVARHGAGTTVNM
jgi:F-type H+-transporting ATPase subunit epsilon